MLGNARPTVVVIARATSLVSLPANDPYAAIQMISANPPATPRATPYLAVCAALASRFFAIGIPRFLADRSLVPSSDLAVQASGHSQA